MAERDEQAIHGIPTRTTTSEPPTSLPLPKYNRNSDSMEQIQQDFRKAIADMEARTKALIEEMKRMTGQ